MKKIITALFFVIFIYNCGVSQNYSIDYNNSEPSDKQESVINEIKKDNEILLFFDGGYVNDKIQLFADGTQVFEDIISTDNTLGVAKDYKLLNSIKKIRIKINDNIDISLDVKKEYSFINIDKKKEKIQVEYRKFYKSYQ
ncbi:hypothetical protein [Aquimarina spongiae]|uniref:Uncharacterized protein n=1 Tax=Aquimarina spongiae TaxID=570521 RepID=A0A1M6JD91_9FLAO|nr:hypothetical protein [Aquimarina spongiae]SHJ44677.1 hypothetical protein SAMN04488508_1092 [Aquimarina spongiae]